MHNFTDKTNLKCAYKNKKLFLLHIFLSWNMYKPQKKKQLRTVVEI